MVNLSGSLLFWDLVVVCGRMTGRCTKMHLCLNPTAQITFSNETEPRLSINESVTVLNATFQKMVSLKNNLAARSCQADTDCHGTAIGMSAHEMESPTRTVTVPVPDDISLQMMANQGPADIIELDECMMQGARLQMSMAGLQSTITANVMLMSTDVTNASIGGKRPARRPIEAMRVKLREVAAAIQELEITYDVLQLKLASSKRADRGSIRQDGPIAPGPSRNQDRARQTPLLAALLIKKVETNTEMGDTSKTKIVLDSCEQRVATSTVTRVEKLLQPKEEMYEGASPSTKEFFMKLQEMDIELKCGTEELIPTGNGVITHSEAD
jgi:hypothetical protein